MGVILSAFLVAKSSIQKSRNKKKTKKNPSQETTTALQATSQQPLPHSETQGDSVEGLRDDHLAAVPPSATSTDLKSAGAGQVERNITVEAPLQLSGTATNINIKANGVPPVSLADATANKYRGIEEQGKMASDEDYAAFLDKANEDPNKGVAKTQASGKIQLKAVDPGVEVPAALKEVTNDAFYVSDADEPFEPVCLKHKGKTLPDEVTFAKLVNHPSPKEADVSIMDIGEWDSQGQYKELVDAVRKVTKGSDVRVYRIGRDGARVEYFVVGLEGGRLLGVKALAIES